MKLSVNTGFLVNRYPSPSQWAKVIGDLGVKHIQLTSDLFSPYYDDEILDDYVEEINFLKKKYNFSITSVFTGGFTRVNHFCHPDEKVRNYWLNWFKKFCNYSKKIGITCFSTPFDETAVKLLEELNCPAYKISSFEIVDIPLINLIAKTKKPIILSTGMASYKDIDLAIKTISKFHKKIILLYCVSGYPTPMEELNLISMLDLKKRYSLTIGLSDHSRGTLAPIIATSLGAALIEKHFTIDKNDNGPDSFFSITKEELKDLCISTTKTWLALGSIKDKKVKKIEKENYKFRRSLYVIKNIKKGDFFTKDNIKSVRPGDGIHPKFFDKIIGKKAKKNLYKFNPLTKKDF